MRFLVDECTGSAVADWLKSRGHIAFFVYDEQRGMDDEDIIAKAFDEHWILITNDKDCGAKMYEEFHYIDNIVTQLPPIFERFYDNAENSTCKDCGTKMERPPKPA